ncbi:DUF6603 domain-containing protein [Micromonospora sp. 4G57]|uniref:DUF6603 domain-containing protein n=1 Tax=Micromonospora sicca TaxID=2202420 RepID=A0ABU5J6M6_9ACTN|nr:MULTISPECIES: DUF6603 domain-containing protein [unclassified Micromonospora]MDZ5443115.1 DUF6603 domain-containing protein [Micromonospora sp. 4G57]MDZ5488173.1 DUF6603 domain-containing protein [Micromonospora sp. 4G53]
MTDGKNALALLWDEVRLLAEPVLAAYDPWRRARLMRALGWDLEAVSGFDAARFEEWAATVGEALAAVAVVRNDAKLDSLDGLRTLGEAIGKVFGQIGALPSVQNGLPDVPGLPAELADDLVDLLVLTYLLRRAPWSIPVLDLLGLVDPAAASQPSAPMPPGDAPIRLPRRRDELHLERVVDLVRDPGGYFRERYAPAGWETPEGVAELSARLLPRLARALRALGLDADQGVRPGVGPDQGEVGRRLADSLLRLRFSGLRTPGGAAPPGAGLAPWTPTFGVGVTLGLASWDGRLTVILAPTGEAHLEGSIGAWNVATDLSGAGPAIAVNSAGVTFSGDAAVVKWAAEVARIAPAGQPGWIFGSPNGTHLAIGQLVLGGKASLGAGRDDVELTVQAGRAELVVRPGDGDGLLGKLLPADGLRIGLDLGLAWSMRGGLHLSGAAALAAEYPVHLSWHGLGVQGLRIALTASTSTRALSLVISTTVHATLGPLHAVVENIGVSADLTFPPALPAGSGAQASAGNLGAADLRPKFKGPDGVGLRMDNGIVSGGGYLFVDEPRGMYAGVLQLGMTSTTPLAPMKGFRLQATAILNTRNPDGSRLAEADGTHTFSLLLAGTYEWFPGLMLFWGISITGLGLVVGWNRRTNPEEVRNAARAGTLDALLFPQDPVGNAPAVIATLSRIFPVDTTGTVLGAMVRLNFLGGQVVADLAVLVEFPDPVRILLLGKLVIDFKEAGKFRLDSAGVVDFARREISVDAALIDSKLFGRPVSGEMALRARWGEGRTFAVSIGGFHPRYPAPPGFPPVKRFAIALQKSGKGLGLTAYLAVTSNTAQFGAELKLHFEGGGFVIDGRAWLDVMFQFKPFWFTAEIGATVSLKYKDKELLAINLIVGVSGPGPWRAWGEARIKFLFWEVSAKFSWTDGKTAAEDEPTYVDAGEALRAALSTPDAWEVRPALTAGEPVTLRDLAGWTGPVLLQPGALLAVRENVLPLDTDLSRMGTSRISGPNRFTLTTVDVGAGDEKLAGRLGDVVEDDFAPGQFRDLSPEEQLTTPGFVRLAAGRTVALPADTTLPAADLTTFAGLADDSAYDRIVIDDPDAAGRPLPAQRSLLAGGGDLLARFAATSPAAFAGSRRAGPARFTGPALGLADAGPASAGFATVPAPRRGADDTARTDGRRSGTLRRVTVPRPRITAVDLEVR